MQKKITNSLASLNLVPLLLAIRCAMLVGCAGIDDSGQNNGQYDNDDLSHDITLGLRL
jgi:hypothetical protein